LDVEPEIAFIDLPGLLEVAENFVSFVVQKVLADNESELKILGANIDALRKIVPPFYR
jgi:asparaginyl-tRNA synthetase